MSRGHEGSAMVRMIVGRRHVGESLADVCRYVLSRMKVREVRRVRATPRGSDERNHLAVILREARACHRANRDEYRWVMGGLR